MGGMDGDTAVVYRWAQTVQPVPVELLSTIYVSIGDQPLLNNLDVEPATLLSASFDNPAACWCMRQI